MMEFIKDIQIGLLNGWWFSLCFLIVNWLMILNFPKHFKVRVLKRPDFSTYIQRITAFLGFAIFQGIIFYSVFIPIKFNGILFYAGLLIFISGIFGYSTALFNYATTDPKLPVTKGIYKYSRNPQQLMSSVLWIGAGLTMQSWIIVFACLLQLIIAYPGFIAQEQSCRNKYGQKYIDYMEKTPRYFINV
ncbi:hypothetical protein KJ656_16135 [bacterium]|nr:hypothetical protein [bacterium]